jgi:outer membrane immunogenic protein
MSRLFRAVMLAAGLGLLWLSPSTASGQIAEKMEVGANYNYVRSNAPPGDCGCFAVNGGSGWFSYNLNHRLALVGEVGSGYASNINSTTSDLTLTSFLAGPRYSWHRRDRVAPFGQVLLGGAHASGALTPGSSGLVASANSFAMTIGGGVDVILTHRLALRAVQADYYLTRFDNGGNNHQNNLRIGTGIVFRIARKD